MVKILDAFVMPNNRYGFSQELDKLVDSKKVEDRLVAAQRGYAPEVLHKDFDWRVRRAVAKSGYFLSKLKDDSDWRVRFAVARQQYNLPQFIKDSNEVVRSYASSRIEG